MAQDPPRGHRFFEHTADLGLEAWGASLGELLEEVVAGLCELIADVSTITPSETRPLSVEAEDREELLVSLANEVLFYLDSEAFLSVGVRLSFAGEEGEPGRRLVARGELLGEPYDPARHLTFTEIKSTTYHDLVVHEEPNGRLSTRVVFDV
jgi:SHS2 domain-containing protein